MSFLNYLESEDLFLPNENETISEPMEMESSTSNISNNTNMDILRHSTRKHKSSIWDHCESLPNGWRCVVKLNNGELYIASKILENNESLIHNMIPPLTDSQGNYIKKKLIEFLIKDSQPFYILKSPSFQHFIHSLNPHFKIPCIDVIKESLFILYDHSINELKDNLFNNCLYASLTTDFWTSTNQKKGFMGITCTWISENFEPNEVLLNLVYVPYPHTGPVIKDLLENEVRKWELNRKLMAITTDNGSNMVCALRLLKNSLEVDRVPWSKGSFLFFSPKQLEALEKQQERLSEDYPRILKPIGDVATCWNSTYMAWDNSTPSPQH
nr:12872_t:CDS:2 [Entrophospora candida]